MVTVWSGVKSVLCTLGSCPLLGTVWLSLNPILVAQPLLPERRVVFAIVPMGKLRPSAASQLGRGRTDV